MRLQNNQLKPFYGILMNNSVLINFGVVFGSGNDFGPKEGQVNSDDTEANSVFVPKINGISMVRDYEENYQKSNSIELGDEPEKKIICLKINLENIESKFEELTKAWRKEFTQKNTADFGNRLNLQYSKQSLYNKLIRIAYDINNEPLEWGDGVEDIDWNNTTIPIGLFDPFINMTPYISSVEIVVLDEKEEEDQGNNGQRDSIRNIIPFIQEGGDEGQQKTFYKYIPIIYINEDGELEQLLEDDYVFVCPSMWLNTLKENEQLQEE